MRAEYDVAKVEAVLLVVAADLYPRRLSMRDLSLEVVVDPDDDREMEVARRAIFNLKAYGLFQEWPGEGIEPTPPGLRAVVLLT